MKVFLIILLILVLLTVLLCLSLSHSGVVRLYQALPPHFSGLAQAHTYVTLLCQPVKVSQWDSV